MSEYKGEALTADLVDGTKSVKVMAFSGIDTLEPLCEAESVLTNK